MTPAAAVPRKSLRSNRIPRARPKLSATSNGRDTARLATNGHIPASVEVKARLTNSRPTNEPLRTASHTALGGVVPSEGPSAQTSAIAAMAATMPIRGTSPGAPSNPRPYTAGTVAPVAAVTGATTDIFPFDMAARNNTYAIAIATPATPPQARSPKRTSGASTRARDAPKTSRPQACPTSGTDRGPDRRAAKPKRKSADPAITDAKRATSAVIEPIYRHGSSEPPRLLQSRSSRRILREANYAF